MKIPILTQAKASVPNHLPLLTTKFKIWERSLGDKNVGTINKSNFLLKVQQITVGEKISGR